MITKQTLNRSIFNQLQEPDQRVLKLLLGIGGKVHTSDEIGKVLKKGAAGGKERVKKALAAYAAAEKAASKAPAKAAAKPAATAKPKSSETRPAGGARAPFEKKTTATAPVTPVVEAPEYEVGIYRGGELVGITLNAPTKTKEFLLGKAPNGCSSKKITHAEALKASELNEPLIGLILLMRIMTIG